MPKSGCLSGRSLLCWWEKGGLGMRFYRWVKKWAERVAALRIPLYAGNSAFFLLLSLFPLMSILLAILQRTSLQEADVLRLLAQVPFLNE